MNNTNSASNAINVGQKKPDLLDCFPDLDYEMIPYKEPQSDSGQPVFQNADQFAPNELKVLFKNAQKFDITSKSRSELTGSPVLRFFEKSKIVLKIYPKADTGILIPVKDILKFRKSKKYTKLKLKNDLTIYTKLNFKKLKKSFSKNGFSLKEKWNPKLNNKEIHLPKA